MQNSYNTLNNYHHSPAPHTDSLFSNYDTAALHSIKMPEERASMLEEHSAKPNDTVFLKKENPSNDVYFYILGLELLIISVLLTLNRKRFFTVLKAFYSNISFQQLQTRSGLISNPVIILLSVVFIINSALLIESQFSAVLAASSLHSILSISFLTLAIAIFYIIKILLIHTSGWIFNVAHLARYYIDMILLSVTNLGAFLLVFLWFSIYSNIHYLWYLAPAVIFLFSAYRIARTYTSIYHKSDFSPFHFFIYLCTVEILPLIVLGKIVGQGIYQR